MSVKRSGQDMVPLLRWLDEDERERSRQWLAGVLGRMPMRWAEHLRGEHARRGGVAAAVANAWLLGVADAAAGGLPLSASDEDLRRAAFDCSRDCATVAGGGGDALALFARMADFCGRRGVLAPQLRGGDVWPAVRRMMCARWWLRRLRAVHARRCEGAAIAGGVVRRGLWPYASEDQIVRRRAQKNRNALAVRNAALLDLASGESLDLARVVEGSLANPANRRAEMMTRIRGADELAALDGYCCEFWTLTAPSRFHAQRVMGSIAEPNPAYAGATPRDAQQYLCRVWAMARAAWKRRGLSIYGLRAAEPHHDGCPHWHVVAYGPARDLRYARRLLRVYALRDSGGEAGARRVRFVAKPLAGGKAGASYAAKYISKNIDGHGMDGLRDAETGRRVSDSARRVDAWAAAWGVRQFQFFGMPAVGVWRVLRRIADPVGPADAPIERARQAADGGDWCAFWLAVRVGSLALVKRAEGRLTAYGDAAAAKVVGVVEGGRRALLTCREWVVAWSKSALSSLLAAAGQGGAMARSGPTPGFDLPWSGVNNCTRPVFPVQLTAPCFDNIVLTF